MRKNLKDARKRLGLTQPQMAEMIGISTRGYQHMEQGIRIGSYPLWDKLEDITGVHQRILRENFEI